MEVKEVERCCCVVKVFEAPSPTKAHVSCSGVVVHPGTGTVICTGVPFSRFLSPDAGPPPSEERRFLSPRSFSDRLRISVTFSPPRGLDGSPRAEGETRDSEVSAELLLVVNCSDFRQALRELFRDADQWRFYGDEEDEALLGDAQSLSWFALLKANVVAEKSPDPRTTPWQSSAHLHKGLPVVACGSPFGSLCSDLFIGTLSGGIVSNLAGQGNAVILTDARCLPGTEGGGLFVVTKGTGKAHLVGVIVSPFGWKAQEWIGLTLVCSVHAIFRDIVRRESSPDPLRDVWFPPGDGWLHASAAAHGSEAVRYPTVCLVDSVQFWGSGVLVTPQMVVTCRHVVNGKPTVTLKLHIGDRVRDFVGDVLFSTKSSSPYDLALVQLRGSVAEAVVPRMAQSFDPGDSVVVVGYGGLGRGSGPSLTRGVLSKAINVNDRPVMLQTTCAVQAGSSGGAVVLQRTGELLGIVSSNTRDFAAKVTYPHLNFSVPVAVFQGSLQHFHQTKDINVFRLLDTAGEEVRRVWRLQGVQSKM